MDDTYYPPNFYKHTPGGVDPATRVPTVGTVYRDVRAPGLSNGQTAIWRESVAAFGDQRVPGEINPCIFRGWNMNPGTAFIDGAQGMIGSGEENSFQPVTPPETWSESHPIRARAPGGPEVRHVSGYLSWETGRTGLELRATLFNLIHMPLVGSPTTMLSFINSGAINANAPFVYGSAGPVSYQLEVGAGYYLHLPYVTTGNEIIRGWNPSLNRIPIGRERGIHFDPTAPADIPTPATGATLFFSSATSAWASKDSSGTVTAV